MRIEDESGWVELRRKEGEEAFHVEASVGEFAGSNPNIFIAASELRQFGSNLRQLEHDRRGEARLKAMSPDEFELAVRVVDAAGHVTVNGLIGRLKYSENAHHDLRFMYSFELDPTGLPMLVRDVERLLAAA